MATGSVSPGWCFSAPLEVLGILRGGSRGQFINRPQPALVRRVPVGRQTSWDRPGRRSAGFHYVRNVCRVQLQFAPKLLKQMSTVVSFPIFEAWFNGSQINQCVSICQLAVRIAWVFEGRYSLPALTDGLLSRLWGIPVC